MAIIEDMPDEIAGDVWNVQVHGPGDGGRWFVQGPLLGDVPGDDELVPSFIVDSRNAALSMASDLASGGPAGTVIYTDPEK
ncbi:hypothetical protein E3U26_12815 (plasmid) [Paracoccus ferrooxidans]|nr:hypothetical protein E3U26_12815 [Paracoccus ferrooxidans]